MSDSSYIIINERYKVQPLFSYFWPFFGNEKDWITVWDNTNFGNVASGEAARRYYSSKEYLYNGHLTSFHIKQMKLTIGFSTIFGQ
jgi:hypothetical protein